MPKRGPFMTPCGVLYWENGLAVDADGAPNAYAPHGGLDALANAGHPGKWWGVVTDEHGEPVIQGPGDPSPGSYVSPTALCDPSKKRTDPKRYVDSTKVRYVSVPSDAIHTYGIKVGDVAMVFCRTTQKLVSAIVADVGPKGKWGEGSIQLNVDLGLSGDARHGGIPAGIVCIVFKGSSQGWPRAEADIDAQARQLLDAAGGLSKFLG